MLAAGYGSNEALTLLIKAGADKEARDQDGFTALMLAAREGNNEALKMLLGAGADKEGKNNQDFTALIMAAQEGKNESVKMLLNAGANIDIMSTGSTGEWSALRWAIAYGNYETCELLITHRANVEFLEGRRGGCARRLQERFGLTGVVDYKQHIVERKALASDVSGVNESVYSSSGEEEEKLMVRRLVRLKEKYKK